jgi:hypothetical protein
MIQQISSSTLKMEATCSSETWVYIQPNARHDVPQLNILHSPRSENLKIVYFPVHKYRPLDHTQSRCEPVCTLIHYSYKIRFNIIIPPTAVSNLYFFMSRPTLGPTKPPIKWVPGAVSPGVKRPGREVDHSLPSSAEVKKICIYTWTLP